MRTSRSQGGIEDSSESVTRKVGLGKPEVSAFTFETRTPTCCGLTVVYTLLAGTLVISIAVGRQCRQWSITGARTREIRDLEVKYEVD